GPPKDRPGNEDGQRQGKRHPSRSPQTSSAETATRGQEMILHPRDTTLVLCALLTLAAPSFAEPRPVVSPGASWNPGEVWKISVELYPRDEARGENQKDEPRTPARYHLYVIVAGTVQLDSFTCWQLDFLPAQASPARVGESYRVLVDQ